ncbi:MAG: hypothetical protein AMJ93_08125 [Anaerolineae bacterium SM23_84]|nr:MAG: hypothetical protein AMJ93_08125 [Anaerolineae bacterium SM23_84]
MAKKTRRARKKRQAARPTLAAVGPAPTPVRQAAPAREVTAQKVDLALEYQYVFSDLRRIALIAAVMFVLLFALNFVLK